jgi:hypothetical protein
MARPPGSWRTLDDTEIALVKRMNLNKLPRDYIMSFFVRPGRVISPAAVSELKKERPEIEPASLAEVEAFIQRRLSEATPPDAREGFDPTSSIRVRELLQSATEAQSVLPGFESFVAEFKSTLPTDKPGKAKVARTLAAFANHRAGYIFFGIENDGTICGLPDISLIEKFWDELSDVVMHHFTPFFRWDRSVVEIGGKNVAVAYAYEAPDKPVFACDGYAGEIFSGQIYFRYNRSTDLIRGGDLINILNERDRRAIAVAGRAVTSPDPAVRNLAQN